jgi:hypothetical protein
MMQELEATKTGWEETMKELEESKTSNQWKVKRNRAVMKALRMQRARTDAARRQTTLDAERIAELERELAQEKEKVKANADAQVKLEQLKKQWSSMSTILSESSSIPAPKTTAETDGTITSDGVYDPTPQQAQPTHRTSDRIAQYQARNAAISQHDWYPGNQYGYVSSEDVPSESEDGWESDAGIQYGNDASGDTLSESDDGWDSDAGMAEIIRQGREA